MDEESVGEVETLMDGLDELDIVIEEDGDGLVELLVECDGELVAVCNKEVELEPLMEAELVIVCDVVGEIVVVLDEDCELEGD